jgi:hypothetical protein
MNVVFCKIYTTATYIEHAAIHMTSIVYTNLCVKFFRIFIFEILNMFDPDIPKILGDTWANSWYDL